MELQSVADIAVGDTFWVAEARLDDSMGVIATVDKQECYVLSTGSFDQTDGPRLITMRFSNTREAGLLSEILPAKNNSYGLSVSFTEGALWNNWAYPAFTRKNHERTVTFFRTEEAARKYVVSRLSDLRAELGHAIAELSKEFAYLDRVEKELSSPLEKEQ